MLRWVILPRCWTTRLTCHLSLCVVALDAWPGLCFVVMVGTMGGDVLGHFGVVRGRLSAWFGVGVCNIVASQGKRPGGGMVWNGIRVGELSATSATVGLLTTLCSSCAMERQPTLWFSAIGRDSATLYWGPAWIWRVRTWKFGMICLTGESITGVGAGNKALNSSCSLSSVTAASGGSCAPLAWMALHSFVSTRISISFSEAPGIMTLWGYHAAFWWPIHDNSGSILVPVPDRIPPLHAVPTWHVGGAFRGARYAYREGRWDVRFSRMFHAVAWAHAEMHGSMREPRKRLRDNSVCDNILSQSWRGKCT